MTPSSPPPSSSKTWLLQRAQLVARLRHPNLVRMLPLPGGAGLTPVPGNARRLADFILPTQTFRRFELPQVLSLLLDVLSGLQALHELELDGVHFVHGEVSPLHIYVDEHGTGRLVPLASSHLAPNTKPESTGYVAPERLLGDRLDARADVYSVGVMLWEALAGRPLFPDKSPASVLAGAIAGKRPRLTPPRSLAWAAPLCAIAERAIATDPAARFASAHELGLAIAQAARAELSRLRDDNWQEEAPTPVFMPRVHLAPRSTTPPATVVELDVDVDIELPAESPLNADEVRRRHGRPRALILGLMSVGVAAIGWLVPALPLPSPEPAAEAPRNREAGGIAAALPAATPAPAPAPPAPALAPVSASASASAPASAAPSASAPTSASVAPPRPTPARAPRRAAPRSEADYGI